MSRLTKGKFKMNMNDKEQVLSVEELFKMIGRFDYAEEFKGFFVISNACTRKQNLLHLEHGNKKRFTRK